MFANLFKTAWRSLLRNKGYALINVFGLALGLSLCLAVYLVTSFELSYDTFYPGKERIYRVVTEFQKPDGETQYLSMAPDPLAAAIKREFTGVDEVAQLHNFYAKVSVPGTGDPRIFDAAREKEQPSGIILAGPEYFDIFHCDWLAGKPGNLGEPKRVALTESQARKYFGEAPYSQLIGRELIYSDSLHCIVAGVIKDKPANSTFAFTDFISAATIRSSFLRNIYELDSWENWASESQTFVRLRDGASPEQFEVQSRSFIKKMNTDPALKTVIRLQPLTQMHFDTRFQDRYSSNISLSVLYILMAIAAFVLLIAAVNFINLSTAQSVKRAKEIGIRKVLGGSRRGLVVQFLAEALFITFMSAFIAALFVPVIIIFVRPFMPGALQFHISPATILFVIAIILFTALLAGIYPAKVMSAYAPVQIVKGMRGQNGPGGGYLRQGLIVFQFTISILLIIGAAVMGRQVQYTLAANMGFSKTAIINIPLSSGFEAGKTDVLAQYMRQLPSVELVSVDMGTPFQNSFRGTSLRWPASGRPAIDAQFQTGDENYIRLYQMKLVAGRDLMPSDTMHEVLINETCAKKLGFTSPADAIGKMLHAGTTDGKAVDKLFPVVGVIADYHAQSFHQAIAPVFISTSRDFSSMISIKLSMQSDILHGFRNTITNLGKEWKNIYPNDNFHWAFFEDSIASYYKKEVQAVALIDAATAVAIFISCMGLLGLVAYTTSQRRKEISIRKVLGASPAGLITMLSGEILKLIVVAALIASPFAWWSMHKWLQNFAYRISISWWFFAGAGFMAVMIALLTIGYHAFKAAVANPVNNLRAE